MDSQPTFSIIIPVFNSEKYLGQCLDSIICQSFSDFEVILVDDGSTDNSATICKAYSSRDDRIKYIHQNNTGTSSARNTGIDASNGKYITFIDNDDCWVSDKALQEIQSIISATNADVIMHQAFEFYGEGRCTSAPQIVPFANALQGKSKAEQLSSLIENNLLCSAVWTKICSAELVKTDIPIYFPAGMRNEDTYWTGEVLLRCQSIAWCDLSFYAYRKGHSYAQTSKPLKSDHLNDLSVICLNYCDKVAKLNCDKELKKALYAFIAYPYTVWMGQSYLFKNPRTELKYYDEMKELSCILEFDLNKNVHLVKLSKKFLGYRLTCKSCALLLKLKYKGIKSS